MENVITPEQITEKVSAKMKQLEDLSFLERYAMFMGKAQLVEFGLKNILINDKDYEYEEVETKTLGWTITELKENNLREDFLALLGDLLRYRNHFAHDFLADQAFMNSLLKDEVLGFTKPFRELTKALFVVEQTILVYDFINEGGSFWKSQ